MNNTTEYSTTVQARANLSGQSSTSDPRESNDVVHLNPKGRNTTDEVGQRPELVKCKRPVTFSTFNSRTLSITGRLEELVNQANENNIDIICIQEHSIYHPSEELNFQKLLYGYQFITSSAWKNAVNATHGGVGFLLSPKACSNLINIEKITSRIIIAEFTSNPVTTVISCYSPHNARPEEEVDEFYKDLKKVVEDVPAHNLLTICGDFNAKIGSDDALFSYHQLTNRNGEKLLEFTHEFNLVNTNTRFMNKPSRLWTFTYPSGEHGQLDYILIRKKWINSVKNSRAYSSFTSVLSDHRIVSAKIQLSLRCPKKRPGNPMKQLDWKQVHQNQDLSSKYAVDVFNRFIDLCPEDASPTRKYEVVTDSVEDVALKTLPKKAKASLKSISSHQLVEAARKELKAINSKFEQFPTAANKKHLQRARNNLQNAYDSATAEYIQGKIDHLQHLHITQQHSAAWKTINEISGRKAKPTATVKGGSAEKRKEGWMRHFKNLLGESAPITPGIPLTQVAQDLPIETSPFTMKELTTITKQLSNSKSPGPDNIPPMIWKDQLFHPLLLEICNHVYTTYDSPTLWVTSDTVPLPKKGNLSEFDNYRGISLTAIAAKVYNRLILNRIYPALDPILRRNQNGFRKGRTTQAQILALRRIVEEMKHANKELTIAFVDFKKAFDSINRDVMFEILHLYGIPNAIIKAIKALYTNTKTKILTPDGETDVFDINAGVLQGDTLAPFLFVIVIDYVLRISLDSINSKGLCLKPRASRRHPAVHLTDLDFADDLALPANSIADAESLLQSLEEAAAHVGLYCNTIKTEYTSSSNGEAVMRSRSGATIKKVEDFKYLGSYIMDPGKDLQIRKGMAWTACNKLSDVWKSNLPNKMKISLFKSAVEPVLLYGSETWTLRAKQEKQLDGCYTRLLMRVQDLSWKKHPTLKDIYGSMPRISSHLQQRRTRFAGHCYRAKQEIVSDVLLWKQSNSRKLNYLGMLSRDTGIAKEDLGTAMADRAVWKEVVEGIPAKAEW